MQPIARKLTDFEPANRRFATLEISAADSREQIQHQPSFLNRALQRVRWLSCLGRDPIYVPDLGRVAKVRRHYFLIYSKTSLGAKYRSQRSQHASEPSACADKFSLDLAGQTYDFRKNRHPPELGQDQRGEQELGRDKHGRVGQKHRLLFF